jgi:hypothetical protein
MHRPMQFDQDRAPLRSALIGAVVIGTIMQTMYQEAWLLRSMGLYAAIHVFALGLVVPICIAMMTRKSPALVTTLAVVLARLPMMLIDPTTAGPVAFTAFLVWFACTLPSLASDDVRRGPGERMASRWWMPVLALVLFSAPYVVRAAVADRDVPVGFATAIITIPVALVLIGIWIPAFLTDLVGAVVTGRAASDASVSDNPTRS